MIARPSGITVQAVSNVQEPVVCRATSLPGRRRYLTEKTIRQMKMPNVIRPLDRTKKKKSTSSLSAAVEAAGGKSGSQRLMSRLSHESEAGRADGAARAAGQAPPPSPHRRPAPP